MPNFFRCRRCLYPSTKPDLWFDARGICSACLAYDARQQIDWDRKQAEFQDLVHTNIGRSHDVIVACSGGKDSTAQIVKCIELGLRPLAVTATTDHLSEYGRANLDNIGRLCDHVEVTPNRELRKRIAKFALLEVGDISWCEHHLIWSVPAREAVVRGIPIVLYGECPQNEYGAGPKGSECETRLTEEWMHEFGGLLGLRLADLVEELPDVDDRDLEPYRYPHGADVRVRAVFMGAFFPWDGYANYLVARQYGFTDHGSDVEGSLYGYENLDNLQTGIHDRLRWLKFGYSRACDIASNHIRRSRLTRDQAIELVHARERQQYTTYLGVPIRDILAAIDVSETEYAQACERFTNHEVVQWASSYASFRHYSGTSADASRDASSTQDAA